MQLEQRKVEEIDDWVDALDLEALRRDLLRFAQLQMRDPSAAEDVVQETLSAAYLDRSRFAGRSQARTWIYAILKNKIVDWIRHNSRYQHEPLVEADGEDDTVDALFAENDHWHREHRPADWGNPHQALESDHFWVIFELCLTELDERIARVFTMREFLGFETGEICAELEISENNCWTILHRARSRLRLCLETRWLGEQ